MAPKKKKNQKLDSFETVLQPAISLDDQEWRYSAPDLPSAQHANEQGLAKAIYLTNDSTKGKDITLRLVRLEPSRATAMHSPDKLLLVSLATFRPAHGRAAQSDGLRPSTPREYSEYSLKFLRAGVIIQGRHYNFYGHSNSQLKSRTCFLLAYDRENISRLVESLGDFTKMKTVAKKTKRIGLLFSTAHAAFKVSQDRCEDIGDVEGDDYVFSDGCGLISPHLARELSRILRLSFRNVRYTPSVFQIRYRGYKGVVTLDPTMAKSPRTWLKLRKSMKKFSGGDDMSFAVVESSKPYVFGNLNDEVIVLLHSLGISENTLMRKQDEHMSFLAGAKHDPRLAFRFLSYINEPDLAERVLLESLDAVQPQVSRLVEAEYVKMLNKRDEQRCRILIPKSRLLFGICDAWDVLSEGECAVQVTMDGDGVAHALRGTQVIVTRNPCLHPGDVQKFKAVNPPELAHLKDCIVFTTRGRRPAADMMSGGDLDGDTFFVSWDQDIIPSTMSEPAHYPGGKEPVQFRPVSDDDRLVYFATYTNASLGRVKNLYMDWARASGSQSVECQELNRLFSQCVDGNRIKVPPRLEKAPDPNPDEPFILDVLHQAATRTIRQNRGEKIDVDNCNFDAIELLASRDNMVMSEFELVKMVQKWCAKNDGFLVDFLPYFNYSAMSSDELAWIINHIPPSPEIPSLLFNSLCRSNILADKDIKPFGLDDHRFHWKCIFSSPEDRLGTFLDVASHVFEAFQRKFVVIRLDDRLSIAIYIPKAISRSEDSVVDNTVRLFAFPHDKNDRSSSRLCLPTKMNYKLYCDTNTFQLFERQRGNTWVFLTRGQPGDPTRNRNQDSRQCRQQRQAALDSQQTFDFRVSIALDKFSRSLQTHIGRVNRTGVTEAEIYVISNRDVESMRSLDLWLDQVDTDEVIPLFQQDPKVYSAPSLLGGDDAVDLPAPSQRHRIAVLGDLKAWQEVDSVGNVFKILQWLVEVDQRHALIRSYNYFLSDDSAGCNYGSHRQEFLTTMFSLLEEAPFLAATFTRHPAWSYDDENISRPQHDVLHAHAVPLLRSLILCAEDVGSLVVAPFQSILEKLPSVSLHSFADLVELIALTVQDLDIASDLLLNCLERESDHILVARPAVLRHYVRNVVATALEHVSTASEEQKERPDLVNLKVPKGGDGRDKATTAEIVFRIDAAERPPQALTHVRLRPASRPENRPTEKLRDISGLVSQSQDGLAKIQFFHPLPPYAEECSWIFTNCGLYVNTRTMIDALRDFAYRSVDFSCFIRNELLALPPSTTEEDGAIAELTTSIYQDGYTYTPDENLNKSQNEAVEAALTSSVLCLWGPPGTGKTETIVAMILALQSSSSSKTNSTDRILVTAPTHNAVDNVMRRYLKKKGVEEKYSPLRVSTEVRKVADDLKPYTCDGLVGKEIHSSNAAMRAAKKRVKESRIIFTTCMASGLGLLRDEDNFPIVFIDEASQQTEPESLVPLTKGCRKAILVGDHVQLRPTVKPVTSALGHDVSLFERLYNNNNNNLLLLPLPLPLLPLPETGKRNEKAIITRLMLNIQYRMHPDISHFPSAEFYGSKLLTGIPPSSRPLPSSSFPWPPSSRSSSSSPQDDDQDDARALFIQCSVKEDSLGAKSKSNAGQARVCLRICELLSSSSSAPASAPKQQPSIAILTPYTRQVDLLRRTILCPRFGGAAAVEISSIDGYQGREADIVILCTVRCNDRGEVGFLRDMRRLNVAVTRARSGLIVVGDRGTLVSGGGGGGGGGKGEEEEEYRRVWRRLLVEALVEVSMGDLGMSQAGGESGGLK